MVASFLRDALKVEHEALLEDIEYLHQCLEVSRGLQRLVPALFPSF